MSFRWIPGQGPDSTAIERLKKNFPKPQNFNPQDYFGDLDITVSSSPEESFQKLENFLRYVGSGVEWFHYLLPHLLLRPDVDALTGDIVIFFMNRYPDDILAMYPEFRDDVLHTLGKCLMASTFWQGNDLSDRILEDEFVSRVLYNAHWFMYKLSPLIIFYLKYLKPDEIVEWVESLTHITGKHWNYHFLAWLNHGTIILESYVEPNTPVDNITISMLDYFHLSWSGMDRLTSLRIPQPGVQTFVKELTRHRFLRPRKMPR